MNIFPLFSTCKANDMIRLLKLFRSSRLTDHARQELARSLQALAAELVITGWPKVPMPPLAKPAAADEGAPAQGAVGQEGGAA